MANWDARELERLTDEIKRAVAEKRYKVRSVGHKVGQHTRNLWRANAAATAGRHGVHYPRSITYDVKGGREGLEIEVGPDSSMPQGGMGPGFEFGSIHQPPHLDGQKALDSATPFLVASALTLADLFE